MSRFTGEKVTNAHKGTQGEDIQMHVCTEHIGNKKSKEGLDV
jgi:hypothetical protein